MSYMNTPLRFFPYKNNLLTSDDVTLTQIVEKTGTPVYVYSSQAFLTPLRELQKGLKARLCWLVSHLRQKVTQNFRVSVTLIN